MFDLWPSSNQSFSCFSAQTINNHLWTDVYCLCDHHCEPFVSQRTAWTSTCTLIQTTWPWSGSETSLVLRWRCPTGTEVRPESTKMSWFLFLLQLVRLSELWFSKSVQNKEVLSMDTILWDAPKTGGGVVIYGENKFHSKLVLFKVETKQFEFQWIYKSDSHPHDSSLLPQNARL